MNINWSFVAGIMVGLILPIAYGAFLYAVEIWRGRK